MLGNFWEAHQFKFAIFIAFIAVVITVIQAPWDNKEHSYIGGFNPIEESGTYGPPAPSIALVQPTLPPRTYKPGMMVYSAVGFDFCTDLQTTTNGVVSCRSTKGVWGEKIQAVEITAEPVHLREGWFWPAKVLMSTTIYDQDRELWIYDEGTFAPAPVKNLPVPQKPNLSRGALARLNYNFLVRKEPGGKPVDEAGDLMIYGGWLVRLTAEPTLGPDNMWWCQVKVAGERRYYIDEFFDSRWKNLQEFPPLWIPCELQPELQETP